MGLREDAEAARLAGIERREREAQERKCAQEDREAARREAECAQALEAGYELGIEWDDSGTIWVTDPAIAVGYSPLTYLHLRSSDGVWLRYSRYQRFANQGGLEHRWMVVRKCPHGDHWVTPGGWATTLEAIGLQLEREDETFRKHLAAKHVGEFSEFA